MLRAHFLRTLVSHVGMARVENENRKLLQNNALQEIQLLPSGQELVGRSWHQRSEQLNGLLLAAFSRNPFGVADRPLADYWCAIRGSSPVETYLMEHYDSAFVRTAHPKEKGCG